MKDNKKLSELFEGSDNDMAERIGAHPVFSEEKKEELYSRAKKKADRLTSEADYSDSVSGVERKSGIGITRYASLAAAMVVAIGGLGSGMYFMLRDGGALSATEIEDSVAVDSDEDTTEPAETEIAAEEVTTVSALAPDSAINKSAEENEPVEANFDAGAIALELTDASMSFSNDLWGGGLTVDKSAPVDKPTYDDEGNEHIRTFYPVVDERYPTWDDFTARCYEIYSSDPDIAAVATLCYDESEALDWQMTTFFRTSDSWYVRSDIYDSNSGRMKWDDDGSDYEVNAEGDIIAKRLRNAGSGYMEKDGESVLGDFVMVTTYTIRNTDDGWRIIQFVEDYVEQEVQ